MRTASTAKAFVDSNVLLYLLSQDAAKADRAEALLRGRPTISAQVLNELANVCSRKLRMSWDEIEAWLAPIESLCTVAPLSLESHQQARRIAARHGLSFYDANIVACAVLADCETLWTEDMQHGLVVDRRLELCNPFLD